MTIRSLLIVAVAWVIMAWQSPGTTAAAPPPVASPAKVSNHASSCTTLLALGDSTVDPGNNNRLKTLHKANYMPYGLDFNGGKPTGRFSNARLATDMLAENLGIAERIPAFLDPNLKSEQLKMGVSFASAGSGYDERTAARAMVMSFPEQIEHLLHYKVHLRKLVGPRKAEQLLNKAAFLISAGTNDLSFHYILSNRSEGYLSQYENFVITRVANYTKAMKRIGARKFVFIGIPALGCLPITRTFLGTAADKCDEKFNRMAASFNSKLVKQLGVLEKEQGIKAVYIDIFNIMVDVTKDREMFGFSEVSKGCCGTGHFEIGVTCKGQKTCADPSKYMYWDAVHPTERMYQLITDHVIMNQIKEICG